MRITAFGVKNLYAETEVGPFILTRNDRAAEALLDSNPELDRLNPMIKTWYYMPKSAGLVTEFKGQGVSKTGYIIGKGPSLDLVRASTFMTDGPIFCCNDSIKKIKTLGLNNKIFTVQFDPDAGAIDFEPSTMIVRPLCSKHYMDKKIYLATSKLLGTNNLHPCGCFAIEIAKYIGCDNLVVIGFDGAFGGSLEYANVIGYKSTLARTPDPTRFRAHKHKLLNSLAGIKYVTLGYTDLAKPSSDNTQPSL